MESLTVRRAASYPPLPPELRIIPGHFGARPCDARALTDESLAGHDLNRLYNDSFSGDTTVCTPLVALLSHEPLVFHYNRLNKAVCVQNIKCLLDNGADPNKACALSIWCNGDVKVYSYVMFYCEVKCHRVEWRELKLTILMMLVDAGLRLTTITRMPLYTPELPVTSWFNVRYVAAVFVQRFWREHRQKRRAAAALALQSWWLRHYYDPGSKVCQRRIAREYHGLDKIGRFWNVARRNTYSGSH